MFLGRCLTVFRHRRRVYSLLRSLLEKVILQCDQLVNPPPQVGIVDGRLFSRFFLLSKMILEDSASSILARMY